MVEDGARAEWEWLSAARKEEGIAWLRGAALSDTRRGIRVEPERLRARGELCGTQELVVSCAVREELTARKMVREWPDPPAGELSAPGRRWGVSPDPWDAPAAGGDDAKDGEERETPPRLAVRLPVELGETLVRAAYRTSAPAVEALRDWDTRWGDGPAVILREAMRRNGGVSDLDVLVAMLAPRPEAAAIEERARLRGEIVTTGDLMRAALARAIS
ncbi:hypothetical protein [Streptomyces anthocyanicus]|uniref:hypothetical protein n=1 Tax=Streptomyces anthocyanicus TaxID=68174 RepID=UPI003647EF86